MFIESSRNTMRNYSPCSVVASMCRARNFNPSKRLSVMARISRPTACPSPETCSCKALRLLRTTSSTSSSRLMTSSLVYGEPSHPDRIKYPRRVARRHDARLDPETSRKVRKHAPASQQDHCSALPLRLRREHLRHRHRRRPLDSLKPRFRVGERRSFGGPPPGPVQRHSARTLQNDAPDHRRRASWRAPDLDLATGSPSHLNTARPALRKRHRPSQRMRPPRHKAWTPKP